MILLYEFHVISNAWKIYFAKSDVSMKYSAPFIIITLSIVLIAYSNFAFSSETIVTQKGVMAFSEKTEIIKWEKALETETHKLIDAGHDNLENILHLVNQNTHELEQPARTAYINQCIEMSTFGYELAQKVSKELNPELEQFDQVISEQVNKMLEDSCRKKNEENFSDRRNRLIENFFQSASVSK